MELTLNLTLAGDTSRLNHGRAQARLVSEYLNTTRDSSTGQWQLVPGVLLKILADRYHTLFGFDASASVSYHLGVQGTTLTHSESHSYASDGTFSMTVRFQNYRVWNDAANGLTVEVHKLLFESDAGDAT